MRREIGFADGNSEREAERTLESKSKSVPASMLEAC
jgi:hypothetical protein